LRQGDAKRPAFTEKTFDSGYHFMLMEINGDSLHFQLISERGTTIDSGVITRRTDQNAAVVPAKPAAAA
jgi:hypothetical protein